MALWYPLAMLDSGSLVFIQSLAFLLMGPQSVDRTLELPYRSTVLVADGELDDWTGPCLELTLREAELPEPQGNLVTVRLVWDHEALWIAFRVDDAEVLPAPQRSPPYTLYQWDSVEVYLGRPGAGRAHMADGDFQIIVGCDGQTTAFRGDALLDPLQYRVPKLLDHTLVYAAAACRRADGYDVELAVPWLSLGVDRPAAGRRIAVDLAWNDWLADHPQLPEEVPDLYAKAAALRGDDAGTHIDNPAGLSAERAAAIMAESYLPWGWSQSRDLGYPNHWHTLTLSGAPPLLERLERRLGIGTLILGVAAALGSLAGLSLLLLRVRHRRRVAELLRRLACQQEEQAAAETSGPAPLSTEVAGGGEAIPASPALTAAAEALDRALRGTQETETLQHDPAKQAVRYLACCQQLSITVEELATTLHVSRRTLHRALVSTYGCTPIDLLTAARMREAERLLTVEGRLVKQVAHDLGFASIPHFSRMYKRFHGISPSQAAARAENQTGGAWNAKG